MTENELIYLQSSKRVQGIGRILSSTQSDDISRLQAHGEIHKGSN